MLYHNTNETNENSKKPLALGLGTVGILAVAMALHPKPAHASWQSWNDLIDQVDSTRTPSVVYFAGNFYHGIGDGGEINPVVIVNSDSITSSDLSALVDSLDNHPGTAIYEWLSQDSARVFVKPDTLPGIDTLAYGFNPASGTPNHYDAVTSIADSGVFSDTTSLRVRNQDSYDLSKLFSIYDGRIKFKNGPGLVKIIGLDGRTIAAGSDNELDINDMIRDAPNGIYIISIYAKDEKGNLRRYYTKRAYIK